MSRAALAAFAVLLVTGCASFSPSALPLPPDPEAAQTQSRDDVTVSTAILTDQQARQHFGVDLAAFSLQAVWLQVRNASSRRLRLLYGAIDPDVYSPDEAAFLMRKAVPGKDFELLRQYLRNESMRILLAPQTINQGFVIVPRAEGGRYVDVQLQFPGQLLRFGFALPLPDGDFDYERLDPTLIYAGRTLPDLDADQLRAELEKLPCCTTDVDGRNEGDPLNVVLVGDAPETLAALSRSGWSFTHRINLSTVRREVGAAIAGAAYPVAPVSPLYALGRKQDFAMQRARSTITRRNHMRLWLAPNPVAPAQIGAYNWEEPEGPIAEGQSDDARKPVPIPPTGPRPGP